MKKSKRIENLENYKVIECEVLTNKEIKELEKKRIQKRLIKKELKKRLLKLDKNKNYKLKNYKIGKNNNTIEFFELLEKISKQITNKALQVITYLNDNKWNIKNDSMITDFLGNNEDKNDLINSTIENIIKYGYIYKNALYIQKRVFKSKENQKENTIKLLHNYKHYKNINSLVYYIKKRNLNEVSSEVKASYKNVENEISINDLQVFKNYVQNEILQNDLKLKYDKMTKKNIYSNILKLLKLSNKQLQIYTLYLQGVKQVEISKILNCTKQNVSNILNDINKKIELIKSELYIEYMR